MDSDTIKLLQDLLVAVSTLNDSVSKIATNMQTTWELSWNAISSIATAAGAIGTFIVALLTRSTIKEMRETRLADNRPYVVLYLEYKEHEVWLICKNIGKTAAYDVKVTFNRSFYGIEGYDVQKKLFAKCIPTMAPNYEMKSFIDSGIDLKKDNPELEQDDYILSAVIRYSSCKRNDKNEQYSDEYRVDICDHANVLFTHSTATKICDGIENIASAIKDKQ